VLNRTGSTPNEMLYRGEQYDSNLGLYYLRARYYNPQTGRFMSRDPNAGNITIPASLHKYLYAGGDPVDGRDPSGRDSLIESSLDLAEWAHETTVDLLAEEVDNVLVCTAFDILMEYGPADTKFPWWYCEVGSQ